jgi:hypothetical protein
LPRWDLEKERREKKVTRPVHGALRKCGSGARRRQDVVHSTWT